jgi:transposase
MNTSKHNVITVGVDTGKQQLDIYIRPLGECFSVANSAEGIRQAVARIKRHAPTRVVIEATGRLEQPFVLACAKHQLPLAVVNPIAVRRFAGAIGQLAKTDRLDARLIAHFGEAIEPPLSTIQPENIRLISDLLARRRQLMEMSTMEKNRLHILPKTLHKSLRTILKALQQQLAAIDDQLDTLIEQTVEWKHKNDILQSVPGIGKVMAYTLLSDLPELGQLNHKEIAALAGLAPYNKESGNYRGKQRIRGGRSQIRTVMFMAMMSTIQCNPKFKAFYEKLKAAGKQPKVALVACMRKMITILNTMIQTGTKWNEKLA